MNQMNKTTNFINQMNQIKKPLIIFFNKRTAQMNVLFFTKKLNEYISFQQNEPNEQNNCKSTECNTPINEYTYNASLKVNTYNASLKVNTYNASLKVNTYNESLKVNT